MKYTFTALGTTTLLLVMVVALNRIVDPAGVFRQNSYGQQYAKALIESQHGLWFPDSLDEREFKAELAKYSSHYECVVIGSSHVAPIGSEREYRSFPMCRNLLNLGVSGAGIEDQITLAWLALSSGKPSKLILGIDPWTLAFGKDARWEVRYPEQYQTALSTIHSASSSEATYSSRWKNLFSAQYTLRSLSHLQAGIPLSSAPPPATMEAAPKIDETLGGKSPVVLPDGSNLYSSAYIAGTRKARIPAGGDAYKVTGSLNELLAIRAYRSLIQWSKAQGVQPVFLMTPYHQNVWTLGTSPNVTAMVATETIVRQIGNEMLVPVVGSFRPEKAGCSADEFYDFMHPMASCLARLTTSW